MKYRNTILFLRWRCQACPMDRSLFYEPLTRDDFDDLPVEPSRHPNKRCSADGGSMTLTSINWIEGEVSLEEAWDVLAKIAPAEEFKKSPRYPCLTRLVAYRKLNDVKPFDYKCPGCSGEDE
jgi:hypothetical protein